MTYGESCNGVDVNHASDEFLSGQRHKGRDDKCTLLHLLQQQPEVVIIKGELTLKEQRQETRVNDKCAARYTSIVELRGSLLKPQMVHTRPLCITNCTLVQSGHTEAACMYCDNTPNVRPIVELRGSLLQCIVIYNTPNVKL